MNYPINYPLIHSIVQLHDARNRAFGLYACTAYTYVGMYRTVSKWLGIIEMAINSDHGYHSL